MAIAILYVMLGGGAMSTTRPGLPLTLVSVTLPELQILEKINQNSKKRRGYQGMNSDIDEIRILTNRLLESKKNLNSLVPLINYLGDCHDLEARIKCIRALSLLFSRFLKDGSISSGKNVDKVHEKLSEWLRERYLHVIKKLSQNIAAGDCADEVKISSLRALMGFLKDESENESFLRNSYSFQNNILYSIMESICHAPYSSNEVILQAFMEFYVCRYDDIRFYFLKNIKFITENAMTKQKSSGNAIDNVLFNSFELLSALKDLPVEGSADISNFFCENRDKCTLTTPVTVFRQHQKVFGEAWISFMQLPITTEMYKLILTNIHVDIIPHLADPKILHDFLTDSYNQGGAISLLALNGLFHLIYHHNLDYPDFFGKLYALFDQNMLHLRYRARFLKLADLFLKSTHLPAYLVAAFIKKSARLCLSAPPAAIMTLLPMIHNLLRQHPACEVLIHRETKPKEVDEHDNDQVLLLGKGGKLLNESDEHILSKLCEYSDPFDFSEKDPSKCNALQSSLWELEALRNHYNPEISRFISVFEKKFEKNQFPFEISDFIDRSFDSLIQEKVNKPIKCTPALSDKPKGQSIFCGEIEEFWKF